MRFYKLRLLFGFVVALGIDNAIGQDQNTIAENEIANENGVDNSGAVVADTLSPDQSNLQNGYGQKSNAAEIDYQKGNSEENNDKEKASTLRVNYVPQFIRDQIKSELREELKQDVVDEVMKKAKSEQWGVKDSWPIWLNKIALSGDMRFRSQIDKYGDQNVFGSYYDFNEVNQAGGIFLSENVLLNTTEDRERMLARFRLAIESKLSDSVEMGLRISTGSPENPVSANVGLGDEMGGLKIKYDRAYINLHDKNRSFQLIAGKMANPWVSSNLVWDSDLNFGGLALKTRWNEPGLFFTIGAFPVNEEEMSSEDAWLYGSQLGIDKVFKNGSRVIFGAAYYNFDNIEGVRNEPFSNTHDFTALDFYQKGNTVFDIRNDLDEPGSLWALASDYNEVNITASYSYLLSRDIELKLLLDWVENIGFNEEISDTTGGFVKPNVNGFLIGFRAGHKKIEKYSDWNISLQYKSLERDAVVDAYTDSDFHLGGTDAEGYDFTANYAVAKNTWVSLRMISTSEIDGTPYGSGAPFSIDTYQLDLNSRF